MKFFLFLLSILFGSFNLLHAENPILLGIRGALNTFSSVPDATASTVGKATSQLLMPYLRPGLGSFYVQTEGGSTGRWNEIKGLRFVRFTLGVVSQADQENHISERVIVSLECDRHRTQLSVNSWDEWKNGSPSFFPTAIQMELRNGIWSGSSSLLQHLRQVNGSPITIAGLPDATPPSASVVPRTPEALSTSQTTGHSSGHSGQGISNQSLAGSVKRVASGLNFRFGFYGILIFLGCLFLKWLHVMKSNQCRKKSSPVIYLQKTSVTPPPLPATAHDISSNPIDLIRRRETLMTAAELHFFKALNPLVGAVCMISAKVRLADVFEVRDGKKQQAAFNMIASKHLDFVLTDLLTSRILCAIELDDRSHFRPDRMQRDRFVNQLFEDNELPLVRIPVCSTYDLVQLRNLLSRARIPITEMLVSA